MPLKQMSFYDSFYHLMVIITKQRQLKLCSIANKNNTLCFLTGVEGSCYAYTFSTPHLHPKLSKNKKAA